VEHAHASLLFEHPEINTDLEQLCNVSLPHSLLPPFSHEQRAMLHDALNILEEEGAPIAISLRWATQQQQQQKQQQWPQLHPSNAAASPLTCISSPPMATRASTAAAKAGGVPPSLSPSPNPPATTLAIPSIPSLPVLTPGLVHYSPRVRGACDL
jgi:hypothetical protein